MVTIRLSGYVTEDRHLVVQLPENVPTGEVGLLIEVPEEALPAANEARERARAKLAAAGALSTIWKAPPDVESVNEEDLIELGTLPPGSASASDMVIEMRGKD